MAFLVAAFAIAGCGGGQPQQEAAPPTAAAVDEPPPPLPGEGTIAGKITFEGTAPKMQVIRMSSDPLCMVEGATSEVLLVGAGNGLANVFVYVKDGLGNRVFPVPSTAVVLDQKGCRYTPHVLGIQVGQTLEILSSDNTLHNVHAMAANNREFNKAHQEAGIRHTHTFSATEVMVPFKCDVHKWMNAWVGVLDHPFFAVTAADGTFDIEGLPPGTYTIEAWHERLGTQTQTVTVGEKQTSEAPFTFTL